MVECQHLNNGKCKLLEVCIGKSIGKSDWKCNFRDNYEVLTNRTESKPIANKIKERARQEFMQRWTKYANHKKEGNKSLNSLPIQHAVKEVIKEELGQFKVNIEGDTKYCVYEGVTIKPDCLIEKDNCPTTIISVKTYLKHEQIRETFAYFYLAKKQLSPKKVYGYMVSF